MTLEAMQRHESITLHFGPTDYRRVGIVSLIKRHLQGAAVLDMRMLGGEVLHLVEKQGGRCFGLDGYDPAVNALNSACFPKGERIFTWDLVNIPEGIEERQFDCIVCVDLLNHVPDDEQALRTISTLLKPAGRLLLVVPAHPKLEGNRDRSLGHLRRYTRVSFRRLLEQHEFEVETIRPWNFLGLFPYIVIEKILRKSLCDKVRYAGSKPSGSTFGQVLQWWFSNVENVMPFPIGLSYFVVATKRSL